MLACGGIAGCTGLEPQPSQDLSELKAELAGLKTELAAAREEQKSILDANEDANAIRSVNFRQRLDRLEESVLEEVARTAKQCAPTVVQAEACESTPVVMQDDRMVVGEIERIRVDPPGMTITARVDTGAQSSSLHAEEITEFERDGDDWVRFNVVNDDDETIAIERPIKKYVRVFQQSDKEGSRRPVVEMRILIGNVRDTFEFTLADRSHLAHAIILGRNFLTDIAVVDVGRQYVQPLPNS